LVDLLSEAKAARQHLTEAEANVSALPVSGIAEQEGEGWRAGLEPAWAGRGTLASGAS